METTELIVLKGLSPYIRVLQVYSPYNYRGAPKNLPRKLCLLFAVLIMEISIIIFTVLLNWKLLEHDSSAGLRDISTNLVISQAVWAHIVCAFNNQRIIQLIAHLGNILAYRELFLWNAKIVLI